MQIFPGSDASKDTGAFRAKSRAGNSEAADHTLMYTRNSTDLLIQLVINGNLVELGCFAQSPRY